MCLPYLAWNFAARVDYVVLGLGTMTPAVPDTSRWAYASSIEGTLAGLRKERGGPNRAIGLWPMGATLPGRRRSSRRTCFELFLTAEARR